MEISLPKVKEMRDLGVTIDSQLKFSAHVDRVVADASKLSSFILRTFTIDQPLVYLRLFESLVIPKILYGAAVYRPSLQKDWKRIERVQGLFVRRVAYRCKMDREVIQMKSMEERFDEADERIFCKLLGSESMGRFFTISVSNTRAGRCFYPKYVARTSIVNNIFAWRIASRKRYLYILD